MISRPAALANLLPDAQSRLIVREFAIQTTVGLSLILMLTLLHHRPPAETAQIAVKVFAFYGVIQCVRALRGRDIVGGPSLNRWDQVAAYALCATLFDLLLSWQA